MKKVFICLIFLFFFVCSSQDIYAEIACQDYPTEALKTKCQEIEDQIKVYEGKLNEAKKTETNLKQNIDYLDNQIYLSKLKISESEIIIEKRKQEIDNLVNKILVLEDRMNKNVQLFITRINLSYREGFFQPYMVFLGNDSFAEKIAKYRYLQSVQSADRKFLIKIQETKDTYKEQKVLEEREKKALEGELAELESRKAEYNRQVAEKATALAQTQSEEKVLSAQIENLKNQRQNLMGGVASVVTSYDCQTWTEDDNYFNQADCRWGNVIIGNANYAVDSFMWKYGCAVTSSAMVLKKTGVLVNPQQIAQNSDLFAKSGGYQTDLIVWSAVASFYGKSLRWLTSWDQVDQKLSEGKWVIAHVSVGGYGWGHYVVVKEKNGSDYKIHDPYFGNNLSFHSRYWSADQFLVYE